MNRRELLKGALVGAAAMAGLAGCKNFWPKVDEQKETKKLRGFYMVKVEKPPDWESWYESFFGH